MNQRDTIGTARRLGGRGCTNHYNATGRRASSATAWDTDSLQKPMTIDNDPKPMTDPHLVTLNPEQRHAVEHGVGPLLINAGAGSGKTKTLAHRVAHLIVGGVDPRRIMLLTFSRRAAEEMIRRVSSCSSLRALVYSPHFLCCNSR